MPELSNLVETLAAQVRYDESGTPMPLVEGSFALYPTPDGGAVLAMNVKDGPMAGQHHAAATPKMVRAFIAFASGGSKLNFLKALMSSGG